MYSLAASLEQWVVCEPSVPWLVPHFCSTFLCHISVAHILKPLNVPKPKIDRSPYTQCLPNHVHTHTIRTQAHVHNMNTSASKQHGK